MPPLKHIDYTQEIGLPLAASAAAVRDQAASRRSSGFVGPLVAQEPFAGIFRESVEAPTANGGARALVRRRGVMRVPVATVAQTHLGDKVYASGPATFTLTSTNNSLVGNIVNVPEAGVADVEYFYLGD